MTTAGSQLTWKTKDLNFRPLGTGILLVTVLIVTWLPEMRGVGKLCFFSHFDVGHLWKALGPAVKDVKLQRCVFLVNFYLKTCGKHDSHLTCAYFSLMAWEKSPAFFGVVENWAKFSYTWHILKLVKYPIGSMGLVYCTYLHFPKKINHPWISIYRYRRPMDPSWDIYYSCLCLCYML